jgi:alpha-mannosidase
VTLFSIVIQVGFDALYFSRIDYQDREIRKGTKTLEVVWRSSKTFGSAADVSNIFFSIVNVVK